MGKAIVIKGLSFSTNNLGRVTPIEVVPLESITITGESNFTGKHLQLGITYNPSTTTQTGVSWEITSGGTYATIDNNGMLTVAQAADGETVVVKATSMHQSSIVASKSIVVTYFDDSIQVVPANITLDMDAAKPRLMLKKSSVVNHRERMLYSTEGTLKINSMAEASNKPGSKAYLTDDMYMIDIPSGVVGVTLSGVGLYFNDRNIRVTTLTSSFDTATAVGTVIASSPSTVNFENGAKYLYVRISTAAEGNSYVIPKLTWIYEQ